MSNNKACCTQFR